MKKLWLLLLIPIFILGYYEAVEVVEMLSSVAYLDADSTGTIVQDTSEVDPYYYGKMYLVLDYHLYGTGRDSMGLKVTGYRNDPDDDTIQVGTDIIDEKWGTTASAVFIDTIPDPYIDIFKYYDIGYTAYSIDGDSAKVMPIQVFIERTGTLHD